MAGVKRAAETKPASEETPSDKRQRLEAYGAPASSSNSRDAEASEALAPKSFEVPEVASTIRTETFCKRFVAARRPAMIRGLLDDSTFSAGHKWTLDYLESKAGDVPVKIETQSPLPDDSCTAVEKRGAGGAVGAGSMGSSASSTQASSSSGCAIASSPSSSSEPSRAALRETSTNRSFGKGIEVEVPFKRVVSGIRQVANKHHSDSKGDGLGLGLYMSTQSIPLDEEGRPALFGQLVDALIEDVPIRPRLAGDLLPANINIWMGASVSPTCSGLHHDYHDNIYCLLEGEKHILLVPPGYSSMLKPVGRVSKIYSNGRICYESQPSAFADGSTAEARQAQAAAIAIREIEAKISKIESELSETHCESKQKMLENAELELESVMEAALDLEAGDEDVSDGDDDESTSADESLEAKSSHEQKQDPDNFSNLDVDIDGHQLKEMNIPFRVVTLTKGNCLFIPAGWYHCVWSSSSVGQYHMALNYWFHPPDNANWPGQGTPYTSDFWVHDWEDRATS